MSPESPAGQGPEGVPHHGELTLEEGPDGLELRLAGERPGQGVRATPMAGIELGEHERSSHPLARILRGVEGGVIDATAGLGGDAGVAAALGREVLLVERNQVVH
ncbi:MAG: class I SAM-dependent methyltransferase, partial [Phycisphaerales bacterium]|nr:class I SAM-dependent methyltransferase [Phycisphaerales bacterium]